MQMTVVPPAPSWAMSKTGRNTSAVLLPPAKCIWESQAGVEGNRQIGTEEVRMGGTEGRTGRDRGQAERWWRMQGCREADRGEEKQLEIQTQKRG